MLWHKHYSVSRMFLAWMSVLLRTVAYTTQNLEVCQQGRKRSVVCYKIWTTTLEHFSDDRRVATSRVQRYWNVGVSVRQNCKSEKHQYSPPRLGGDEASDSLRCLLWRTCECCKTVLYVMSDPKYFYPIGNLSYWLKGEMKWCLLTVC